MKSIRLSAAEHSLLREVLLPCTGPGLSAKTSKTAQSILDKLQAATKVSLGISAKDAIAAWRSVLGSRLIEPPQGAAGVFAQIHRRLAALGLTEDQCRRAAVAAGVRWKGPIRAESIARQADALLSDEAPDDVGNGTFGLAVSMSDGR